MKALPKISIVCLGILSLSLFLSTTILAQERISPRPSIGAFPTTKLAAAKLKACQSRERAIRLRSEGLVDMANNLFSKFDATFARVEDYYTSKAVPTGKTAAGYDSLVAEIQTKKAAVQNTLVAARDDLEGFYCTADDPKKQMTEFKEDMQKVKGTLQEYRAAIKNLIVAIRSASRENNFTWPSPTLKPAGLPDQGGS